MPKDFDLKELGEDVKGISTGFEAYKEANDERLAQLEAKGTADPITEEKLVKIEEAMDTAQKRLDDYVLSQKRQHRTVVDTKGNEIDLDAKALKWAKTIARAHGTQISEFTADDMDAYKSAYDVYLRKGNLIIPVETIKALSVGVDPEGGYRVTPDMSGRIVTQVFESTPMRAYAAVQVISSDALEGDFDLDEAGSEWVGETSTRSTTDTPDIGVWRIPVHTLSAKPRATQKLLDDADINVEAWLATKVAEKFARAEATAFVTGDGIARPRGFTTYPDGTTLPTQIERFDTTVNGAFKAAPDGGDVLIDALYGLKPQYRANANWFMNRATTKLTRKLKDSDGNYLWAPGIAAGQPASLMGYPVAAFEDMVDPATGSLSIAVGDMRQAYQIVDRLGIRTLRDPFSAKPYVEFYTTKRVGGDVVNFEALKFVEFSA